MGSQTQDDPQQLHRLARALVMALSISDLPEANL
jgi:hypothetical protein